MLEVVVDHSVGETFTADTNTLKHTVASQLIQHESRVDDTGLFLLVGDDATNEVGVGLKNDGLFFPQFPLKHSNLVKHSHELVQRLSVDHGDSHERGRFALLLATASSGFSGFGSLLLGHVVFPDIVLQLHAVGLLEQCDCSVVERILVLLEEVRGIVAHGS